MFDKFWIADVITHYIQYAGNYHEIAIENRNSLSSTLRILKSSDSR